MLYPKDWPHRLQGNSIGWGGGKAGGRYTTLLTLTIDTVPVADEPDGCEAEVCMSHMDPVSGTDIDLFIEGIIPDSLHLYREKRSKRKAFQTPSENVKRRYVDRVPHSSTC